VNEQAAQPRLPDGHQFSFNVAEQFTALICEIEALTSAVDEKTLELLRELKWMADLKMGQSSRWWHEAKQGTDAVKRAKRSAEILRLTIERIEKELETP
jgi:hypothetical protein